MREEIMKGLYIDVEVDKNGLYIDSEDGSKYWYKYGKYHRIDGPAIEWVNGTKFWLKYGLDHRIDGPAYEDIDGNKEYWLYGCRYREDYYNKLISNLPLLYWNRFKNGEWI